MQKSITLVLLACLLAFAGCSGSDGREEINGTVTLDGQPLDSGLVNFRPAEGTKANSSGGTITEGRFHLPAAKGLMPGEYIVRVQAFQKSGRKVQDPQMGEIDEMVSVRFNETGTLKATVTDGGNTPLEFALTSAK